MSMKKIELGKIRQKKNQAGSVVVESALVLPVLLLIVMGVLQYGMILSAKLTVKNASAVAARTAVLDGATTTEVTQAAQQAVDHIWGQLPTLNVQMVTEQINGKDAKRVTVTYDMPLMFPILVPGSSGGKFSVTASSVMRS